MPLINLALLGLLGLVQTAFLPGHLLLRGLRIGCGILASVVLSFALSLLVNYLLVAGLVVCGQYRPRVMYAILAVEIALWLRLDYRRLAVPLGDAVADVRRRALAFFLDLDCASPIQSPLLRRAMIAAAVLVIAGFALAGIVETGQIFQQWDAVVSWNRWAVQWAANELPQSTSYYPQLLPANISLSYVFMQTNQVWIFAKAMQFLFCLMLLLAMLDAARRSSGLVPGVVVTYWLFVALLRYRMLSSGYADVPLAFFAWMPLYALLLAARAADARQRSKWLLVGGLLAAGAALTKQLGLYVAVVYPVTAWVWFGGHGLRAWPNPLATVPRHHTTGRSLVLHQIRRNPSGRRCQQHGATGAGLSPGAEPAATAGPRGSGHGRRHDAARRSDAAGGRGRVAGRPPLALALGPLRSSAWLALGRRFFLRSSQSGDARAIGRHGRRQRAVADRLLDGATNSPTQDGHPGATFT